MNLEIKAVNPVDDTEIKFKGIEALNKVLVPTAALRFLTLLHREPTDYVEISRRLQTIEDIFKRVKKQKKGQSIVNDKKSCHFEGTVQLRNLKMPLFARNDRYSM